MLKKIKAMFGKTPLQETEIENVSPDASEQQPIAAHPIWIEAENNPWGVRVLDVRPVVQTITAWSEREECAVNATSFNGDDGTTFIGVEPVVPRTIPTNLRYPVDELLADGVLFVPEDMDEKWAIFVHDSKIIFVRSWQRQVVAIASIQMNQGFIEITDINGLLTSDESETPEFTIRMLDALIRIHGLGMKYPLPLPPGMEHDIDAAAHWCFSRCGRWSVVATTETLTFDPPDIPLRTNSLLHIAVARGESDQVKLQLNKEVPISVYDKSGHTAMQWALARPDNAMLELLIELGMPVDARSDEGVTTLMLVAQGRPIDKADYLLSEGADANATDDRGFSALHRCAEGGDIDMVKLLLHHGADPTISVDSHTPHSFAKSKGHIAIEELLQNE